MKSRRFWIHRAPRNPADDRPGWDEHPWYVSEVTYKDDRDDYGRMESLAAAVGLVDEMLKNPLDAMGNPHGMED